MFGHGSPTLRSLNSLFSLLFCCFAVLTLQLYFVLNPRCFFFLFLFIIMYYRMYNVKNKNFEILKSFGLFSFCCFYRFIFCISYLSLYCTALYIYCKRMVFYEILCDKDKLDIMNWKTCRKPSWSVATQHNMQKVSIKKTQEKEKTIIKRKSNENKRKIYHTIHRRTISQPLNK